MFRIWRGVVNGLAAGPALCQPLFTGREERSKWNSLSNNYNAVSAEEFRQLFHSFPASKESRSRRIIQFQHWDLLNIIINVAFHSIHIIIRPSYFTGRFPPPANAICICCGFHLYALHNENHEDPVAVEREISNWWTVRCYSVE